VSRGHRGRSFRGAAGGVAGGNSGGAGTETGAAPTGAPRLEWTSRFHADAAIALTRTGRLLFACRPDRTRLYFYFSSVMEEKQPLIYAQSKLISRKKQTEYIQ
jgi:hypothetical protein